MLWREVRKFHVHGSGFLRSEIRTRLASSENRTAVRSISRFTFSRAPTSMVEQSSALLAAEFRNYSFRFPPTSTTLSSKACFFYNSSECRNGSECKFNREPDERSLRLILDGPSICTDHLLGENVLRVLEEEGKEVLVVS